MPALLFFVTTPGPVADDRRRSASSAIARKRLGPSHRVATVYLVRRDPVVLPKKNLMPAPHFFISAAASASGKVVQRGGPPAEELPAWGCPQVNIDVNAR